MSGLRRTCFVTYELHPTTPGGCGMLLHHAAELLLEQGQEVVFLFDFDEKLVAQFREQDRLQFPNPERCVAYSVAELAADFPWSEAEIACPFQYKALRFAFAVQALLQRERVDFLEFFEYCGVGYYAFARKLYGLIPDESVLGSRLHNSIELIDTHEATKALTLDRYLLYTLERAALDFSEAVLGPTRTYVEAFYETEYGLDPAKTVISQSPRRPFPEVPRLPAEQRDEIVYFGRVYQFKGVDKLVHAAVLWMQRDASFPGRFVFIGPDTKESPGPNGHADYLRSLVPEPLRERFEFTGPLGHEEAATRMARARLAAFPNEFESFCYALHEVYHAGIPVVIADLPGYRDFFEDGRNCRMFDGSVGGLLEAMRELWEDPEKAEALSCPAPVANEPLGDWYERPSRLAPLVADGGGVPRVLALILAEDAGAGRETLCALEGQEGGAPDRVVVLRPAEEAEAGVPFLGRRWIVAADDTPGAEIETLDALWILEAGDEPDPSVLGLARTALSRRASLSFAGTWLSQEGIVQPSFLDVAPEVFPFRFGPRPTRAIVRSEPGRPLVDLFDDRLGAYGEIGHLWRMVESRGPGCLLPEPRIAVRDAAPRPPDPIRLSFLVMTQRDPERLRRLARFATVVRQDAAAEPPSARRIKRLTLRTLGAGTLFKLAFKRLFFARR